MKKDKVRSGLEQMLISLDGFGCEDVKYYEKIVDSALHHIKDKVEPIIEIDDLDDFYYKIKDNILYWSEYGIEELNEVEDLTELKIWQYNDLVEKIYKHYPDYDIEHLKGRFI